MVLTILRKKRKVISRNPPGMISLAYQRGMSNTNTVSDCFSKTTKAQLALARRTHTAADME
jgi:hypothetical protein